MDARFYLGSSWDEMLFKFLDAVRNSFVRISGLICDFDCFQFYARRLEPTGTTQLQSISLEPIEYSSRELIPFSSTKTYKTESGSRARISSTGSAITIWCIPEKLQDFSDKEKVSSLFDDVYLSVPKHIVS